MNVQVDWNGQNTTIPHPSVPAFRLLCEQYGVFAKWDAKEKKLLLKKEDLKGKRVCLISKSLSTDSLEMKILRNVEHFLSETGMEILVYSNPSTTPKQGDVFLQCTIQYSARLQKPESTLVTAAKPFPRTLVESLQKDLRNMEITNKVHRIATKRAASPFVHIDFKLPDIGEGSEKEFIEQISISLASGILRYFQEKQPMTLLASLPQEIRQIFMDIVPSLQTEPSAVIEKAEVHVDSESSTVQSLSEPIPQETSVVRKAKAEVFFDYTLLLSQGEDEDDGCLIVGNLHIKNTGTEPLYNPTVALHVDPPKALNIGGQILPPNVVDTLGVQNQGATVWKFLETDYVKKGRENGQYLIGTKEPLVIEPGQTEMHGLQITVIKSRVDGAVTIKGAVQFAQGLQFVSNNQITLSL